MDIQNLNINNNQLFSEIYFDINKDNFNQLVEVIKIAFKKIGIKIDEMLISYQRYANKSSILAIKLLQGSDNDIDNYIFFGCNVDNSNRCDIFMHSEAKFAEKALQVANLITSDIIIFFNNVEMDLSEKNLDNLEISFKIPLGEDISHDTEKKEFCLKKLVKSIFK